LFTNVIPYSFNFYSVPKITLSIALSVSAVGNLLTGAFLVSRGSKRHGFPVKPIAVGWLMNVLMFLILTLGMGFSDNPLIIIVGAFFFLAVSKTLFDISLNNYIFSQEKQQAAQLSSLRQTLTAVAGIALTLLGALAIETAEPVEVLVASLAFSFIALLSWHMSWQRSSLKVAAL
jgi:predicted MFS family arabinose efflux permease